jgi:hypothetical protein
VIGFFGRLASGAAGKISNLISTVRGIGGRIRSAVGNLASLLVNAGRNVIQGLINGITQKLGALRSKAASAASTIRNLFPFSPAKEGPLSGKGSPDLAGEKIVNMIAAGLERQLPAIRKSAARVADVISITDPNRRAPGHRNFKILQRAKTPHKTKPPKPKTKDKGKGKGKAEPRKKTKPPKRRSTTPTKRKSTRRKSSSGTVTTQSIRISKGAVQITIHGTVSEGQAAAVGRAAGRGLIQAFEARNVRTTVRSM